MPTFDSASFPTDVTLANGTITGGPSYEWTGTICGTADGTEQRNSTSRHARRTFDIRTGPIDNPTRESALLFYDARRGQSDSFRFKDPFDHTASGEPIVSGQLVKRYTVGSVNYDRPITKPISGTVTFGGGGTLDYSTGIISGGAGGTWSGEFEIQARFDTDRYVEHNYYSDWHEVELRVIEVFESPDIPLLAASSLDPIITYAFALPVEIGRRRLQDFSTYIVRGGGYSEDRVAEYNQGLVGFAGNVMLSNRTNLETLLSLFLCVRGTRSGFQYETFNMRFGNPSLRLSYTGNESFECPVSLLEIPA